MHGLDVILAEPDRVEIDRTDVASPPDRVWKLVRHGNLARSPLIRALFSIRTLPTRLRGGAVETVTMRIDDIVGGSEPGFRLLAECEKEVVVGAIGKVWKLDIPFLKIETAEEFAAFDEPGYTKVAWALRVLPRGELGSRIEVEVRVRSTDDESRRHFRRYFRFIGPGSRFIRHHLLRELAKELGSPEDRAEARTLDGDELIADASAQMTHSIVIDAEPEAIWPWLVQMGCRRAGWYSYDLLDNAGIESAKEIHPELQSIDVGDVLPATPDGDDGFEVLRLDSPRVLILGGLFDLDGGGQLPFRSERPERYWHVSWAFVLEPLDAMETRLWVRARAAFPADSKTALQAAWIRPVHHFMENAQLSGLKARAERKLSRDGVRNVAEGLAGAGGMVLALLTPFLRPARSHWGVDEEALAREYPGDELVPEPRWSWTHGVAIDAPADAVWPWVAQVGADRAGFYSYQWLENVVGCEITNAETLHPEWQHRTGGSLLLHPSAPPLPIVALEPGRYFIAHAPRGEGEPWASVSWLFLVESLEGGRSRFVSRFRSDCSDDLATRLAYGSLLTEPVGFVMDRKMLLGVKQRAERRGEPSRPGADTTGRR